MSVFEYCPRRPVGIIGTIVPIVIVRPRPSLDAGGERSAVKNLGQFFWNQATIKKFLCQTRIYKINRLCAPIAS
jgi:hypothetical protein